MRISASLPRNADASRLVTSACSGASGSPCGGGMCSSSTSKSGSRFSPSGFSPLAGSVVLAMPARPEAYSVGSPSAYSAAFWASSSRSEATSSSRSWLSETTSAMRASGRSVLLTHQDHRQVRGQRLAQHEAGLRQRALGGVDQQQHAVDHRQPAFDLATEVGVAGGVDDVDHRHAAVGVRDGARRCSSPGW